MNASHLFDDDPIKKTIDFYENNAQEYVVSTVDLDLSSLYFPFLELLPPNASILDAGCGSGRDSLFFINKGYRVTSFDASPKMVAFASRLIEKPVLHLSFLDLDFQEQFDGIWACASLIHIPQNQIQGVLTRLSNALKPSGYLYASFKYGNGESLRDDRWFNDFDEDKFLALLVDNTAFKSIRMWTTNDIRPERKVSYWLNTISQKRT